MNIRAVCAYFALLTCLSFSSCSKQAKIRRSADASKDLLEEARTALLRGRYLDAKSLALRAKARSSEALSLARGGPHEALIKKRLDQGSLFANAFDEPEACVRFWFQAMADEDVEVVTELFDTTYILERLADIREDRMDRSEMEALRRAFDASCERTTHMYSDILVAWHWLDITSEIQGEEAVVKTAFQVAGSPLNMDFWLRKNSGLWRPVDFSLRERRASDILWDLGTLVDDNVDFTDLFQGKGIFEAFADLRQAEKYGSVFHQKPLLGHYVRLVQQVELEYQGLPIQLEEGRILRVIDQVLRDGEPHLTVRTTEADPNQWCMGFIPEDAAEHLGTDETEVWGVG